VRLSLSSSALIDTSRSSRFWQSHITGLEKKAPNTLQHAFHNSKLFKLLISLTTKLETLAWLILLPRWNSQILTLKSLIFQATVLIRTLLTSPSTQRLSSSSLETALEWPPSRSLTITWEEVQTVLLTSYYCASMRWTRSRILISRPTFLEEAMALSNLNHHLSASLPLCLCLHRFKTWI